MNGDGKLTEFEASYYAKTVAPRDYALADGTIVTVDPQQPLPAAVVEDFKTRNADLIADVAVNHGTTNAHWQAMFDGLAELAARTGRPLGGLMLVQAGVADGDLTIGDFYITFAGNVDGGVVLPKIAGNPRDREERLRLLNEWAETAGFEVIDFT